MGDHHRLVLMRHAKSAYPAGVADHDRPLAPRGIKEAALAGDWLRANLPTIDGVLCSTAIRARQTLGRVGIEVPVRYVERLYDASPETVIDEIKHADDELGILLVIAHEPAISQVAIDLAGADGTDTAAAESISAKFPTSGLAVLEVGCRWQQLMPGGAALTGFHVPREA